MTRHTASDRRLNVVTNSNDHPAFRYQIDDHDRITFVDDAWLSFALANEAPELTERHVIGQPIWKFLAGKEVRELYRLVFNAVRSENREIRLPFRCDSPTCRRTMELRMSPEKGRTREIAVEGVLLEEEQRPYVALFDPSERDPDLFVVVCSWCKRVHKNQDRWLNVEAAIVDMDLLRSDRLPNLSHGICPDCAATLQSAVEHATNARLSIGSGSTRSSQHPQR